MLSSTFLDSIPEISHIVWSLPASSTLVFHSFLTQTHTYAHAAQSKGIVEWIASLYFLHILCSICLECFSNNYLRGYLKFIFQAQSSLYRGPLPWSLLCLAHFSLVQALISPLIFLSENLYFVINFVCLISSCSRQKSGSVYAFQTHYLVQTVLTLHWYDVHKY